MCWEKVCEDAQSTCALLLNCNLQHVSSLICFQILSITLCVPCCSFFPFFTVKDLASSEAQQRSLTAELDSVRAKLSEVGDERRRGKIHNLVIDVFMIFMLLRSRTWHRIPHESFWSLCNCLFWLWLWILSTYRQARGAHERRYLHHAAHFQR